MNKDTLVLEELRETTAQIDGLRKKALELSLLAFHHEVQDYEFVDELKKTIKLSELFGDKEDLLLIHNMGKSCPYCTLWADGLNGSTNYLLDRMAFYLVSPNEISDLIEFKENRTWQFPCLSSHNTSFSLDLGFSKMDANNIERFSPGYSTFYRKDGKIYRYSADFFGPGDVYAPIWHMIDHLSPSSSNWRPSFQ